MGYFEGFFCLKKPFSFLSEESLLDTQVDTIKDGARQKSKWPSFTDVVARQGVTPTRLPLKTLQINVGKLCNQVCLHCHVDAGPSKTKENMTEETAARLVKLASEYKNLETVDLTGGAPELNPHFRYLVTSFRELGLKVIDRCNLTVLFEKGQEDTPEFLAKNKVSVVASLPCYSQGNVDKQRGDGVFGQSIDALKRLNGVGYGRDEGLSLDLVYNPVGASLPPAQKVLEEDYKKRLQEDFGIVFNNLYTITNMPIKRFLFDLRRSGKYDSYMKLLSDNFNPQAASQVMCRSMISVGYDGGVYDCDFNQMLHLKTPKEVGSIFEVASLEEFSSGKILLKDHCFGCTAGAGSSCGGSLA